jgi:hypothetical protein
MCQKKMSETESNGGQALLAEKAAIAAEHAELAHQNAALLARLELLEAGGLGPPGADADVDADAEPEPGEAPPPGGAAGAGPGGGGAALAEELDFLQGLLQQCAARRPDRPARRAWRRCPFVLVAVESVRFNTWCCIPDGSTCRYTSCIRLHYNTQADSQEVGMPSGKRARRAS